MNDKTDPLSTVAVDTLVSVHSYRAAQGCKICAKCGTAKHSKPFEGFKYWFAGVGHDKEPECRAAA
jgi:hypothetical protein